LGANLALALNNSATGRISAAWSARLRGSREGASDTRSGVDDAAVERCADCGPEWDPPAEDSTARGAEVSMSGANVRAVQAPTRIFG